MSEFVRYLVIGKENLRQHSYSTQIKDAFLHAVTCADHWTMRGDIYGEKKSGERILVRESKNSDKEE